jgi:hypothetical protein
MHRGNPHDRNPGCARPPKIKQALRFLQPIGLDVGPQQGELDQIVLGAAAANAFVLPDERAFEADTGPSTSEVGTAQSAPNAVIQVGSEESLSWVVCGPSRFARPARPTS